MDQLLHARIWEIVAWVGCCRWKLSSATKTQKLAGKVIAHVFCDACEILFIDYLEKDKTINTEYYMVLNASNEWRDNVKIVRKCKIKRVVTSRQFNILQVRENDDQIERTVLQTALLPVMLFRCLP